MGSFSPIHWLIVLIVLGMFPVIAYWRGKKAGDQQGYIRGYKEGQQSAMIQQAIAVGSRRD